MSDPQQVAAELTRAVNRASAENGSNTPDYVLGEFLAGVLEAFNTAIRAREEWHGSTPNSISAAMGALLGYELGVEDAANTLKTKVEQLAKELTDERVQHQHADKAQERGALMSDTPMSTDPRDIIEPGWQTSHKRLPCNNSAIPGGCGGEVVFPPGVRIAQCVLCHMWTGRFAPTLGGTISGMCMTGGCEHCKYTRTCDHECHASVKPTPYYIHIRVDDGRLGEAVTTAVADEVFELTGGNATVFGSRRSCDRMTE